MFIACLYLTGYYTVFMVIYLLLTKIKKTNYKIIKIGRFEADFINLYFFRNFDREVVCFKNLNLFKHLSNVFFS